MNTLEAPRLLAAHHPSMESDTAAFCPPGMGRKSIHHAMFSQLATSQMPNLVGEMASKLWPVKFFIYKINQEWPSIHVPIWIHHHPPCAACLLASWTMHKQSPCMMNNIYT